MAERRRISVDYKPPSVAKPNFGSSGNSQQNMLLSYMLGQAGAGNVGKTMNDVKDQFPGGVPPGSSLNAGRNASVSVPLNRELNQDERADISTANVLEPHFNNIINMVNSGYMEGKNNLDRTMRQGIVDTGQPLMAGKDAGLQGLQSEFNKLKSKLPFDAGGKQLTGTEKALVFKLLNTVGKSNETIVSDLSFAMDILRERKRLAIEGSAGAVSSPDQSPIPGMSQQTTEDPRSAFLKRKGLLK